MVNFTATRTEKGFIHAIAQRAVEQFQQAGHRATLLDFLMDIEACHCNGCPLDLEKLLSFDDANLLHDVGGIRRHLDRSTGQLRDCFLPRCSK